MRRHFILMIRIALDRRVAIQHRMIAGQNVARVAGAGAGREPADGRHASVTMSLRVFVLRGGAHWFSDNFLCAEKSKSVLLT